MGYLNKVMIIGNLGQEPEKKITPNGHSVVNISIATNDYYKDSAGNKQERTEWHRVVFWGKLADLIAQYTHKGSPVYVEGALRTNEWQDKDGNKRYTTEINASACQLLSSSGQGQNQNQSYSNYQSEGNNPRPSSNFGSQNNPSGVPNQSGGQRNQFPPQNQPKPPQADNDFIEDDIPF